MCLTWEYDQKDDGRWIALVQQLPGLLVYGSASSDAMAKAEVLALGIIADRPGNGDSEPASIHVSLPLCG